MGDDLWMARYLLHRVAEVHLEHGDSLKRDNMTKMLNQIEPAENVTLDFWQNGLNRAQEAQSDSPDLSTKL